jgi:LmbE family N-acetylglucosaminyl deacetylase
MRVLVVAPHPDDEILGVGGTIAKLSSEGNEVYTVIVTRGDDEIFDKSLVEKGREEAKKADKIVGIKETIFLEGFPAAKLDTIPHYLLNDELKKVIREISPEVCFIPFYNDLHIDHRIIFDSVMVASRPIPGNKFPRTIYCYETLSETNWNMTNPSLSFVPNVYFDISSFIERKIEALKVFESQLKSFPHERSVDSIIALSKLRGSTVGLKNAEAFILIREIL